MSNLHDLVLREQAEQGRTIAGAAFLDPLGVLSLLDQRDPADLIDEQAVEFVSRLLARKDEIEASDSERRVEIATDSAGALAPFVLRWLPYPEDGNIIGEVRRAIQAIEILTVTRKATSRLAQKTGTSLIQGNGKVKSQTAALKAPENGAVKTRWTLGELMGTNFPEPLWVVPDLIPAGLTFLAGRPKIGKSWLALQLACSVGVGGVFMGKRVDRQSVLYLALEDSPRRIKQRAENQGVPADAAISVETEWAPLVGEGLAQLLVEVESQAFGLIIIDTFSRALGSADQLDLTAMTRVVGCLQSMASKSGMGILLVDHHRKTGGFEGNAIDDLLGSTGKAAAADCILGIYREQGKRGATLKLIGRDVEEIELMLEWDAFTYSWQNMGIAHEVRANTFRADVLEAIRVLMDLGEPATTTRIGTHMGAQRSHVSRALADLVNEGLIYRGEKEGREQPYLVTVEQS